MFQAESLQKADSTISRIINFNTCGAESSCFHCNIHKPRRVHCADKIEYLRIELKEARNYFYLEGKETKAHTQPRNLFRRQRKNHKLGDFQYCRTSFSSVITWKARSRSNLLTYTFPVLIRSSPNKPANKKIS